MFCCWIFACTKLFSLNPKLFIFSGEQGKMAQILAPSTQWQMRIAKHPANASPMTAKMWSSLLLKQNKKGSYKSSAKFRVCALKSDNSTVNRLDNLLNLDVTPYTDKIIAEYIWYTFFAYICLRAISGSARSM